MKALVQGAAATASIALGAGAGYAVMTLPEVHPGLAQAVAVNLPASGVENPVTAVLLNFRSYDTLLEIAVLALAVIGIWSLSRMRELRLSEPGLVLGFLVGVLVPFMVLLGAYLLWAGSHAPGGAFQAGAVFAAAGVLMLLAGVPAPWAAAVWMLRLALMLGLITFMLTGAAMMLIERNFLEFPPEHAKSLVLVVEAAAAISIGAILATAFRGGRPREPGERP